MSGSGKSWFTSGWNPRRIAIVMLVFVVGLAVLVLWFAGVTVGQRDPLFRGKPESEWVKNLKYSDDEQVKEWRGYGADGAQVLIRGLERANRPGERSYRQLYRRMPGLIAGWLPAPKSDSTRASRMCLVSLLSSLGDGASNAVPIMIQTVDRDEADSVRQSAINFFTTSEDEKCRLNRMSATEKQKLLPGLIHGIQDGGNWGLRNNAANALKWYPEQREIVAPVLVAALKDAEDPVCLLAAEALNRIDPAAAKRAGAVSVVVAISKNPNDQIASRAAAALRHFKADADVAVPALIDCLECTNTLVACDAVWSLEWSPPEFKRFASSIVPALQKAAQRNDNVAGYAKAALKRFESEKPAAKDGK